MYTCENLCQVIDKSVDYGRKKANQVIQEFGSYLMRKNKFLVQKLMLTLLENSQEDPVNVLRTKFLNNPNVPVSCTTKFYEILKKNHYLEETEILECMSSLSNSDDYKLEQDFWCLCPWIKKVEYNSKMKMFQINTTKGDFHFFSSQMMFPEEVKKIKKKYPSIDYNCHGVTFEFAKLHPEYYAATCMCPNAFPNSYWLHSYNVSYHGDFVVDISNGFVIEWKEFEALIEPLVLDKTLGSDLPIALKKIEEDKTWPYQFVVSKSPLKALAFYSFDHFKEQEQKLFLQKKQ